MRSSIIVTLWFMCHVCAASSWNKVTKSERIPSCAEHTIYSVPVEDQATCVYKAEKVYFNTIADFKRPSSLSLFVNQVCRALSFCIPPSNFRLIIHSSDEITATETAALPTKSKKKKKKKKYDEFVPPANSLIGTAATMAGEMADIAAAKAFLAAYSIKFDEWQGVFDPATARRKRLEVLKDVALPDQIVLQADLDEFPMFRSESKAAQVEDRAAMSNHVKQILGELSGSTVQMDEEFLLRHYMQQPCDYYLGSTRERVAENGSLLNITLPINRMGQKDSSQLGTYSKDFTTFFPLTCNFPGSEGGGSIDIKGRSGKGSREGAGGGASSKLVMYRALYRPSIGDRKLSCASRKHSYTHCIAKLNNTAYLPELAQVARQPVACGRPPKQSPSKLPAGSTSSSFKKKNKPHLVPIDHYKFTHGTVEYLQGRVQSFKTKGLPWHVESQYMLDYLAKHDGKFCVDCTSSDCLLDPLS